jgi:membrane fusion protein, multidrug efflux system
VHIEVDGLPGVWLLGVVERLAPACGASYSAIAPHNATGNFTKIVQRLPVRIRIEPGQAAAARLKVGMSVVPNVHIEDRPEPRARVSKS